MDLKEMKILFKEEIEQASKIISIKFCDWIRDSYVPHINGNWVRKSYKASKKTIPTATLYNLFTQSKEYHELMDGK